MYSYADVHGLKMKLYFTSEKSVIEQIKYLNIDHELLIGGQSINAFFIVNRQHFYIRRLVSLSSHSTIMDQM